MSFLFHSSNPTFTSNSKFPNQSVFQMAERDPKPTLLVEQCQLLPLLMDGTLMMQKLSDFHWTSHVRRGRAKEYI
jgi:hypothetical protein